MWCFPPIRLETHRSELTKRDWENTVEGLGKMDSSHLATRPDHFATNKITTKKSTRLQLKHRLVKGCSDTISISQHFNFFVKLSPIWSPPKYKSVHPNWNIRQTSQVRWGLINTERWPLCMLYAVTIFDSLSIILPVPKHSTSFCFLCRDQCHSSYCILHWL